jgi:SAM-dependent methyltransferase
MTDALERQLHHDQRRAYLIELLRTGFSIDVEEIELEHNVRLAQARGRVDLLYRDVVFEVKRDLARELADVERELTLYLNRLGGRSFGIATDGRRFLAFRLTADGLQQFDELNLDSASDEQAASWLDSYLFSAEDIAPNAEDVVRRFGPKSAVFLAARDELEDLWRQASGHSEVSIKREEWDRLLRVVYGSPKGSDDLFLRHTYLALVARLFAYLAIAGRLPTSGSELQVITGEAFEQLGISNLVEEDFFAWIADDDVVERATQLTAGLARHLSVYATSAIDEDLLKELYETLVDPIDRHDLGEYYTPDWLADLVLEEAGYTPGTRILDPACGSGTFVFSAVRRLRAAGLSGAELVREAQTNIVGFDVHPLAVTVARANFVLALGDDATAAGELITVPIWMADSLAVPEQSFGRPIEVSVPPRRETADVDGTMPARERFVLPTEMEDVQAGALAQAAALVAEFADLAMAEEDAVKGLSAALSKLGANEFVNAWTENLRLFRRLVAERRNTVWAFVLSNAVRPQMISRSPVDLVVGNPPWLAFRDIDDVGYQQRVTQLALDYGLIQDRRGWRTGALDLATVFACFSLDHYVRPGGKVAFVLPRGVLYGAKQHDAFRGLGVRVPMRPVAALDLDRVKPLFRVPACVVIVDREKAAGDTQWPVREVSGTLPRRNASPVESRELSISDVSELRTQRPGHGPYLDRAIQGATIAPRPFWFVEPTPETAAAARKWVRTDSQASQRAKHPWTGVELEGQIEAEFIYATMLSVYPFRLGPVKLCALPIDTTNGRVKLLTPRQVLQRGAPGFHRWLTEAEAIWAERKKDSAAQDVPLHEYLDNHRNLTRQLLGGVRVVYGADGSHVRAAVVETDTLAQASGARAFVFDMNTYWIRVKTSDEAHYLTAVLNSPFVDAAIKTGQTRGAWGARHIHRRPFEVVPIPEFDALDESHTQLAELSRQAHQKLAGLAPARTLKKQLEPIGAEIAEADTLARQVCTAGTNPAVLG